MPPKSVTSSSVSNGRGCGVAALIGSDCVLRYLGGALAAIDVSTIALLVFVDPCEDTARST